MASTFKNFLNNDIASTRTLLHEAIPITGSIISGTYRETSGGTDDNETNIKNYSHGQFQSVFDYPHLSSSANHIFDISMGYHHSSSLSGSGNVQNAEKINMYNQMAQILVGPSPEGEVRMFPRYGDPATAVTSRPNKFSSVFFLNFSRLIVKDEIKKGTFSLDLYTGSLETHGTTAAEGGSIVLLNNNITRVGADSGHMILQDHNAATNYHVNSPAGEYGYLFSASADQANTVESTGVKGALGVVYYQAGIAVITSSVFRKNTLQDNVASFNTNMEGSNVANGAVAAFKYAGASLFGMVPNNSLDVITGSVEACFVSGAISASCGGLRNAIHDISFNNTTELNSTIYFCRASHNEYNYSSNPTYIDTNSKIRVKETSFDQPTTYITSIGLYSADNELLAVAKLSEPIKKTPENELTFRVRLDY